MERQKKVVDASVIVKWFLDEEGNDKSLELKNQHIQNKILLVVPELIFLEVLNALKFKEKDEEKLIKISSILLKIRFMIIQIDRIILEKAVQLSLQYDLTIYDALYAALAQIYECPLITADKKLQLVPQAVGL